MFFKACNSTAVSTIYKIVEIWSSGFKTEFLLFIMDWVYWLKVSWLSVCGTDYWFYESDDLLVGVGFVWNCFSYTFFTYKRWDFIAFVWSYMILRMSSSGGLPSMIKACSNDFVVRNLVLIKSYESSKPFPINPEFSLSKYTTLISLL